LSLPPGYVRALRYEIALAYAAEFRANVPPQVAEQYSEIRRNMTAKNIQNPRLDYDVAAGPGVYNVLTDELY
jgi:hypothetical protein